MFKRPYLSTIVLLTVATFDLVTTLIWLHLGQVEGNPLFAAIAKHGAMALVAAKLVFLFVPIWLLEYARSKRPKSAEIGTWVAAVGYIYLYASHLIAMNHHR